jgi:hypothetical protein
MRIFAVFLLALTACSNTQNIYLETSKAQAAGQNGTNVTKIRVAQTSKMLTPAEPKTVKILPPKTNSSAPNNINSNDLNVVTKHCEAEALEVVYLKFNCTSYTEKQTCSKAKLGEKTYLLEFKHCLSKFGWKAY